jgi:hypothetical protein
LAFEILKQRTNQGFSIRQTIVESLLYLEEGTEPVKSSKDMTVIMNSIEHLANLFLKSFNTQSTEEGTIDNKQATELPSSFLSSIKSVVKPGIQM